MSSKLNPWIHILYKLAASTISSR